MSPLGCVKISTRYLKPFGLQHDDSVRTKSYIYVDREYTFSLLAVIKS